MNFSFIVKIIIEQILPHIINLAIGKRYLLIFSCLSALLSASVFFGSRYIFEDNSYLAEEKRRKANNIILPLVKRCGDGSAISLSVISSQPEVDAFGNETFLGLFQTAYAMEQGRVINLQTYNPLLYDGEPELIDRAFYNFLLSLDDNESTPSTSFNLEAKKAYQDTPYPTINKMLFRTDWGKQGKLNKLYITSVVIENPFRISKQLIYVITFIKSVDFQPSSGCDEVINDLRILKNKIKNL
jgi:hypothetical protein